VADVVERLVQALGPRVRRDAETLAAHSRDAWVLSELDVLEGRPPAPPRAVVEPESTQEISRVLALCREARVPVVPFGGGSGVCGGIRSDARVIVLSTKRLAGLRALDDTSLCASFGAGTNGMQAEQLVREHGLTIGIRSRSSSTVAGWVATRASGQFSTAMATSRTCCSTSRSCSRTVACCARGARRGRRRARTCASCSWGAREHSASSAR
jgi:alkyldihydroxyacetonephosphate synthase